MQLFAIVQIFLTTNLKFLEFPGIDLNFYFVSTAIVAVFVVANGQMANNVLRFPPLGWLAVAGLLAIAVLGFLQGEMFGLEPLRNRYALMGIKALFIFVTALFFGSVPHIQNLVVKSFLVLGLISAGFFLIQIFVSPVISVWHAAAAANLAEVFASYELIDFDRGIGLSQSPFSYVLYLIPSFYCALCLFRDPRASNGAIVLILLAFTATIAVRDFDTAWLALAGGTVFYLALSRVRSLQRLPVAATLLAATGFGGYAALWALHSAGVFDGNHSALSRLFLWDVSWQLFTDSPVIGRGFGRAGNAAFFSHISGIVTELDGLGTARDIHSDWYELLGEGGLVAVIGYFLFIVGTLTQGARNFYRSQGAGDRAVVAAFFAILCQSMLTSLYHNHVVQYTLAAIVFGRAIQIAREARTAAGQIGAGFGTGFRPAG